MEMISDYSFEEFEEKALERFQNYVEQYESEDENDEYWLEKALNDEEFTNEFLSKSVRKVYDDEVYFNKSPVKFGVNRILKFLGSEWNTYINEQEIKILDPITAVFVGGDDWSNNDNLQDLLFMTDEGVYAEILKQSSFGYDTKKPSDDLEYGEWYSLERYENGDYVNIYRYERVDSAGLADLHQLQMQEAVNINDIEPVDVSNYRTLIVRGRIWSVKPIAIWEPDYTKPAKVVKDKDGSVKKDASGNVIMEHPSQIVGYEPLVQYDDDGRKTYVMRVNLADIEDSESGITQTLDVRFYPQDFGIKTLIIPENVEEIIGDGEDDPELLAPLISDYLKGKLATGMVKMTGRNKDRNEDDRFWLKGNGVNLFVHD